MSAGMVSQSEISSDQTAILKEKSKVYPALLFSFKMEVWSDEISDWDTTPADKCVSQPPLFCARFSKLGHSSRFTIEYVRTLEKLDSHKSKRKKECQCSQ